MVRYILILILTVSFLVPTGCDKQHTKDNLRITVNSWVGFGPLYLARENGIFERLGLTVDIVRLESAPDRRAALLSDRVDVLGSTLDDLAVTLSQGVNAVAFSCADYSNGGDGIIVSDEINEIADLTTAEIAVQPGFVNHFFLLYVLDAEGLDIDNLNINPMTPDDAGAAFIAGTIDAAVTWEPFLSQGLIKRPGSRVLARSSQYPEAILDLFVCRRSWFDENKSTILRFQQAWDEALEFLHSNQDAAHSIIGRAIGLAPEEVASMLTGAHLLKCEEGRSLLEKDLDSLSMRVERLWRTAGYVDKDIDLTKSVLIDCPQ